MSVEFDCTREDLERLYSRYLMRADRYARRNAPQGRQAARRWLLIPAIVLGAGAFVMLFFSRDSSNEAFLLVAGAVTLGWWAMRGSKGREGTEGSSKSSELAATRAAALALGRHRITIEDAGVRSVTPLYEILFKWPYVLLVEIGSAELFIDLADGSVVRVPLRAFSGTEHVRAFRSAIERQLAACGVDISGRLCAFFEEGNAKCPGCGYSLVNLQTARCPECSRAISLEDFPDASFVLPSSRGATPDLKVEETAR